MKKKAFLIIGAGTFGRHLCRCMAAQGAELMVVDQNPARLEELLPLSVSAKIGDCTNPEVLRSFGGPDFDTCFVCVGESFENSLVITDLLREQGARKIYSEATRDMQEKFLRLGGADHVIFPEKDIAYRLAVSESWDSIFDYISLNGDYGIFEIAAPAAWVGRDLRQLDIRGTCNLTVLAYKQEGKVYPILDPAYTFTADRHVLVMGHIEDVRRTIR